MDILLKKPLVSTRWLQKNLEAENLRIFDTSVTLSSKAKGFGYEASSGLKNWSIKHIPGAGFLDLQNDLSNQHSEVGFMMPSVDSLVASLERKGIDDSAAIVLYNAGAPMWSTRAWWMLRSIGLTNLAVLDGGWKKWIREDLPVSSAPCKYPQGRLTCDFKRDMWIGKEEMIDAVLKGKPLALNALSPAVYSGEKNQYGRTGHLPGSWNVYYADVLDAKTGLFRTREELAERFEPSGALKVDKVITYCGGGISATILCLALNLCGQNSVAVYDGSMSEWVLDEALPLKFGALP